MEFKNGQLFDDDGNVVLPCKCSPQDPKNYVKTGLCEICGGIPYLIRPKRISDPFVEMNNMMEQIEQDRIDSLHKAEFVEELRKLINRYSMENGSGTPDFILANYLAGCLDNWNETVALREKWYNREQDAKFGVPLDPRSTHQESNRFDK